MLLEQIHDPSDVRKLNDEQARLLCRELRTFLLEQVSRTGGHLASNLGVVELTVAIHRVFDTSQDRLVFDVGHQCYVHKALTGRRELFGTLRQLGGLSGFPKPWESPHDAFIAGHASNSVSVALGMARARTLLHQHYQVLALIGDGALGGGLSFEGLNDAGASHEPMIVILNDNGMSIDPNVGGMSRHLSRLRSKPGYYAFKKRYRQVLESSQTGQKLYSVSHDVKTALKKSLLPGSTLFENMGFTYMGPVDGHDVVQLTRMLREAKDLRCPVLLHVHTVKGQGYGPAEADPGRFHGIGPFDVRTGSGKPAAPSFSSVFGETLTRLAGEDRRICALTAAMMSGTGLSQFQAAFPERFFDVGIAEGCAVSMAAGMAKQGAIPVFAVYSSFLQRAYDMLIHDVAIDKLHVVLGVDRAGLVGADGETHHGCFDVMYLSQVPGMKVFCPASFAELRTMLRRAVQEETGPVAVRYPRGGQGSFQADAGDAPAVVLRNGTDITLAGYGMEINDLLEAAARLEEAGIQAEVVKWNIITPLETELLIESVRKTGHLLVAEECVEQGCVGVRALAALEASGTAAKTALVNCGTGYVPHGAVPILKKSLGLDGAGLFRRAMEVLGREE